ncbi:MAG: hypothetical protein COY58_04755 [Gammaproteobacteria bacterium CG_4_10_14_0_8_um_filter_38_16]|nr:MAG: hypothetical protein COY58_04755 [Gammaproteobacteria bacterium CG_4_10_14_0_8_um_filter_38_16]PJA03168.1 MAG: hypothetical protein COX72_06710 [Gammaproteobacteria bacterium CG_4_10_14_0_2_um_filter_38_22]PJB09960.1 MAG: hypothetical protein CO120_07310 [Gammaproteobacteria bacterium CG_4_9_14_3_um_filter_38_9]
MRDKKTKWRIAESSQIVFYDMRKIVSAIPTSIGMQISNPEAPQLFFQTAQIAAIDLLPMLFFYWVHVTMLSVFQSKENDAVAWQVMSKLGITASYLLVSTLLFRKKMGFFAHSTLLSVVCPKAFDKATMHLRIKSNSDFCKKNCTTARRVKGEARALLAYVIQQSMIPVLEFTPYAIGVLISKLGIAYASVLGEHIGWMLGVASRISHNGQFIVEARLANDDICDRHRTAYLHQHPELFLAVGLLHYFINNGLYLAYRVMQFSFSLLGLSELALPQIMLNTFLFFSETSSLIAGPLATLSLFYLIGLMHYASVPTEKNKNPYLLLPSVDEKVSRHFYEPMMIVRNMIAEMLDLLIPGVIKKFDAMVEARKQFYKQKRRNNQVIKKSQSDEFELIEAPDKTYTEQVMHFLKQSAVQKFLRLALPALFHNVNNMKQDFIVREHWLLVAKKATKSIDIVLTFKDVITGCASMVEFYQTYIEPIQEHAILLSFFTPFALFANAKVGRLCATGASSFAGFLGLPNNAQKFTHVVSNHNPALKDMLTLFAGVPNGVLVIVIALLRNEIFVGFLKAESEKLKKMVQAEACRNIPDCDFDPSTAHFSNPSTADAEKPMALQKDTSFEVVSDEDDCDQPTVKSQTCRMFAVEADSDEDDCGVPLRGTQSAPILK